MMTIFQPFINAAAQSALSLLAIVVIALFMQLRTKVVTFVDSKTTSQQRDLLHLLANEGFALAETVLKELKGPQKLQYAMDYVQNKLSGYGINIQESDVRAAIEKAVLEYNKSKTTISASSAAASPDVPVQDIQTTEVAVPAAPVIPDHVQKLLDAVKEFNVVQSSQTDSQPAAAPADPQATPYQPTPVTTQQ